MTATQSHSKEEIVGAVRLDTDGLERLVEVMKGQVGNSGATVHLTLEKGESRYRFNSIQELRESLDILPATVRDFYLSVSAGTGAAEKSITVTGSPIFRTDIKASAADRNWCIGSTAVISAQMKQYRIWYSVIKTSFFPWIALTGMASAIILQALADEGLTKSLLSGNISDPIGSKIVQVSFAFLFLGFFWNMLFPQWRLILKPQESWLRSKAPEIGSAGVILSLLLAIILAIL